MRIAFNKVRIVDCAPWQSVQQLSPRLRAHDDFCDEITAQSEMYNKNISESTLLETISLRLPDNGIRELPDRLLRTPTVIQLLFVCHDEDLYFGQLRTWMQDNVRDVTKYVV